MSEGCTNVGWLTRLVSSDQPCCAAIHQLPVDRIQSIGNEEVKERFLGNGRPVRKMVVVALTSRIGYGKENAERAQSRKKKKSRNEP
jgi:hypothetical protein